MVVRVADEEKAMVGWLSNKMDEITCGFWALVEMVDDLHSKCWLMNNASFNSRNLKRRDVQMSE